MYELSIDSIMDNELKRNEMLKDLLLDEDEMIAKEEWLRRKGYNPLNSSEEFFIFEQD